MAQACRFGLGADGGRSAGEDLAPGRELGVNFEPHHRFPRHPPNPPMPSRGLPYILK